MSTDLGQKQIDKRPSRSFYDVFISYAEADRVDYHRARRWRSVIHRTVS
jgi:hypothetical protein